MIALQGFGGSAFADYRLKARRHHGVVARRKAAAQPPPLTHEQRQAQVAAEVFARLSAGKTHGHKFRRVAYLPDDAAFEVVVELPPVSHAAKPRGRQPVGIAAVEATVSIRVVARTPYGKLPSEEHCLSAHSMGSHARMVATVLNKEIRKAVTRIGAGL